MSNRVATIPRAIGCALSLTLLASALGGAASAQEEPSAPRSSEPGEPPPDRVPGPGRGPDSRDGRRPHGSPARFFHDLDLDGDGQITQAEAEKEARARFQEALSKGDGNHDGKLTENEFYRAMMALHPPDGDEEERGDRHVTADEAMVRFKALDQNGDGKVYAREVPIERRSTVLDLLKMLGRAPTGYITVDDLIKVQQERAAMESGGREAAPGDFGRSPGPRERGPAPAASIDAEGIFKVVDRNRDGVIDRTEAEVAPPGPRAGVLQMLGSTGKTSITRDEFVKRLSPQSDSPRTPVPTRPDGSLDVDAIFSTIDKNRDGWLTANELAGSPVDGLIPILQEHGRAEKGVSKEELTRLTGPPQGRRGLFQDEPSTGATPPSNKPH